MGASVMDLEGGTCAGADVDGEGGSSGLAGWIVTAHHSGNAWECRRQPASKSRVVVGVSSCNNSLGDGLWVED